ncbi:MAG: hypothetical protein AAFV31_11600 [Pseudomonadota bacterium]
MHRIILTALAISLGLAVAPVSAADGNRIDRIEDRIDRRESIRDERVDRGPIDVIEDRLERRESIRDRAGLDAPRPIDRAERRKIRWWWQARD